MVRTLPWLLAATLSTEGWATNEQLAANPIRKVVTMLQSMQSKISAEGEAEEDLYEKFECYCKKGTDDLKASIEANKAKVPELQSQIEEYGAGNNQLAQGIAEAKDDRSTAEAKVKEAKAIRANEASAFEASSAEMKTNIAAMTKAIAALKQGLAGGFLQTPSASVLSKFVNSASDDDLSVGDRQALASFLSSSSDAPGTGEIVGILEQMKETMEKDLAEATQQEEAAIEAFDGLTAAKTKEIQALTESIDTKQSQLGEGGEELVQLKADLDETENILSEDEKFMADLDKNCETKAKEWEERKKTRADELVALSETIKILNDDDALDLFKKTLPAPSFLQLKATSGAVAKQAKQALQQHRAAGAVKDPRLDFLAIALSGKEVNFGKVIDQISTMVALLKKEQTDDDEKKAYCGESFDQAEDEEKALSRKKGKIETAIAQSKEVMAGLVSDIESITASIKELDQQVAEATELRKSQNAAFKQELAENTAAKELLGIAKNRLFKFYSPSQYVAPKEQELSEEDQIFTKFGGTPPPTEAPGGIAGTGVEVAVSFAQIRRHSSLESKAAPPPPPETFGAYSKKAEESNGVLAMIDLLIKDLDKDMTEGTTEEKNSQADYESFMADSAEKRKLDSEALANKESAKADAEESLLASQEEHKSTMQELMANGEMTANLHKECDWLLKHFDVRKQARSDEIDSLKKASAVLSGADYSFVQIAHERRLRGARA
mmetsp:Transcript_26697/g.58031  ORF Transcript_26697/g.58031 Transcript_26697/m.58031 type:complete len:724 (+) Transcript_26697:119-2290(+)